MFNTRLKDLPLPIRKLAIKRIKTQCPFRKRISKEELLMNQFQWSLSVEGHTFWWDINQRNFETFKRLHPRTKI